MTLKNIVAICAAFLLLIPIPALAVDTTAVETQMRQLLQNKILGLRMPYTGDDLKFDGNGQLVGTSDLGPWTMYSSIQINDVALKDNSLTLDGERVILILPSGKTTAAPMLAGHKIHIALTLTPPVDENSVRGALGDVFSGASVDEHFASYWKPASDPVVDFDKSCKNTLKGHPDGVVGTLASNPVYACVKGNVVSKPKGISTPAPGADSKKPLEGSASLHVIIDDKGYPAVIIAKSSSNANYGAAALSAVSQWKYSPAMKDGKPVPYLLDVDLGKNVALGADNDHD